MISFNEFCRNLKIKNTALDRRCKLSNEDLMTIYKLREEGLTYNKIADKYNVAVNTIARYFNPMLKIKDAQYKKDIYNSLSKEERAILGKKKYLSFDNYRKRLYRARFAEGEQYGR